MRQVVRRYYYNQKNDRLNIGKKILKGIILEIGLTSKQIYNKKNSDGQKKSL